MAKEGLGFRVKRRFNTANLSFEPGRSMKHVRFRISNFFLSFELSYRRSAENPALGIRILRRRTRWLSYATML